MHNNDNMLTDTESNVKYKIVKEDGTSLSVARTKQLAELYVNGLPQELRENCRIIPITEDNKQVLFG